MSWCRTELATVGAWLGACRPPWLLSSSEPTAVELRPAREVAIAMTREDRCDSGIVLPIAFAVVRLTTSSNLLGCSTGMSAALAPCDILSTGFYGAALQRPSLLGACNQVTVPT